VYPFKLVLSPEYRKSLPNVSRWFTSCVSQPQFVAVVGVVELAQAEFVPGNGPAAPQAQKSGKKEKKEKKEKSAQKEQKPKSEKGPAAGTTPAAANP
jgi:hypothetical protein